jgi:tetratricopeptide (TPR) repeat protein
MANRTTQAACRLVAALIALGGSACTRPVDHGTDSAALVTAGWTAYRLSEFQNAASAFEAARATAERSSPDWTMATYGLATTWDLRRPGENPALATRLYRELLATAPTSSMVPWTELALARQLHLVPVGQEPDYAAVNQAYRHILDTFPGHLAATEAFLYLQSIQLAKLEPQSTRAAIQQLLDFANQNPAEFAGPAWALLAVGYHTLGDQTRRFEAEQKAFELTEVDPADPFVEFAWAYWNLATLAEFELGDFATARKYYHLLLEKYPTDIRVYGCKQALLRMETLEAQLRAEVEGRQP